MASGTAPNTSIILTDKEIAFINLYYYGSKSAAIHTALERLMQTYNYTVIEDNGGGLHLFLFHPDSDEPADGFTGFEGDPGSLVTSLDSLDTGDDAKTWEGRMSDPAEQWEYITGHEFGYKVICLGENGQRTVYPERMGRAGQIEFGIDEE